MPGAVYGKTLNIITRLAHGANGTAARRRVVERFNRERIAVEHLAMVGKALLPPVLEPQRKVRRGA